MEKWDYVTIQQASWCSGEKDSYLPYVDELIAFIRARSDAEIVFHQTWGYESQAEHSYFAAFDKEKEKMWNAIKAVMDSVCQEKHLRMIRAGEAIYGIGKTDFFNFDEGGISPHRDGFHLSFNYGRFIAACVWIKFFTGKLPVYLSRENLDKDYQIIKKYIKNS